MPRHKPGRTGASKLEKTQRATGPVLHRGLRSGDD